MKTYEEVKDIIKVFTSDDATIMDLESFLKDSIEYNENIPKIV